MLRFQQNQINEFLWRNTKPQNMSKISLTFDTKKDNMVEVEYQYLNIKYNDMIFLL